MSVAVVLVQRVVQSGGGFELCETSNRKFKFKMDLEEGSPIGEFKDLSEVAQRCSSQFGTSTTGNSFRLFIGEREDDLDLTAILDTGAWQREVQVAVLIGDGGAAGRIFVFAEEVPSEKQAATAPRTMVRVSPTLARLSTAVAGGAFRKVHAKPSRRSKGVREASKGEGVLCFGELSNSDDEDDEGNDEDGDIEDSSCDKDVISDKAGASGSGGGVNLLKRAATLTKQILVRFPLASGQPAAKIVMQGLEDISASTKSTDISELHVVCLCDTPNGQQCRASSGRQTSYKLFGSSVAAKFAQHYQRDHQALEFAASVISKLGSVASLSSYEFVKPSGGKPARVRLSQAPCSVPLELVHSTCDEKPPLTPQRLATDFEAWLGTARRLLLTNTLPSSSLFSVCARFTPCKQSAYAPGSSRSSPRLWQLRRLLRRRNLRCHQPQVHPPFSVATWSFSQSLGAAALGRIRMFTATKAGLAVSRRRIEPLWNCRGPVILLAI